MNGFIDIHTHILPGVDDGAANMEEACSLVRMAWEDGTRVLVLTPHYRADYGDYSPQRLQTVFSQLQAVVAEELPDMQLYLGSEIRFGDEVPEKLYQGEILTLHNSRFILLEFGRYALRTQILLGISEILRYGYLPIIAHAERCDTFRRFPNLIEEVLHLGAYIQINAESVMGAHGAAVKRFSRKALKKQQVHFVATDAHDCSTRTPLLQKCFLWVRKKCGADYAQQVFYENALEIVE